MHGSHARIFLLSFRSYPNIDVEFKVAGDASALTESEPVRVEVALVRELPPTPAGAAPPTTVHAPRFPVPKEEGWWVALGDPKNGTLIAIKRLSFQVRCAAGIQTKPWSGAQ